MGVELDTEIFVLEDLDWSPTCQHPHHPEKLGRGHSDQARVIAVRGIPLPCCGLTGQSHFLCESWIKANPFLRCPRCELNGFRFDEAYVIIGPV